LYYESSELCHVIYSHTYIHMWWSRTTLQKFYWWVHF